MKAGKKKNRNTAEKITKFPLDPSGMEDLEDTELDALLEEELKREADELEARLNSDPKLIGVGASDDLFAKIVGSLKEQGVWEEDEKAVKAQEDEAGEEDAEKSEKTEKTKDEVQETEAEYENGKSSAGEKIEPEKEAAERAKRMEQQSVVAAEKSDRVVEVNTGSPAEKKEAKAAEEKTKKRIEKNIEENKEENTAASADENTQKIRKIESNETEEKNATENVAFLDDKERETKAGSEEAYSQLSEADRRAMEYGYQMQQKDAEKKVRRKKRRKIAKRAGITAAALVAVFGVSMTSDANRKYVLEAWNTVAGSLGMKTEISYLDEAVNYVESTEEEKAQEDIFQKLNIKAIKFGYLPEKWNFISYNVDEKAFCAVMFYSNNDFWMTIYMYKNKSENVMYNQFDGDVELLQTLQTAQNIDIEIYKNGINEEEGYTLAFHDEEGYYYCNVRLSYDEVKKIAMNIKL